MDTKTLHDAAIDAGINLKNDDSWSDCIHVWTEAMLGDEEYMEDIWLDFLAETDKTRLKSLFRSCKSAYRDVSAMSERHIYSHEALLGAYAQSLVMHQSGIGHNIFEVLRVETIKHVEANVHDWFADVQGYAGDMEEGQKEDYLYEQHRDRMLEGE